MLVYNMATISLCYNNTSAVTTTNNNINNNNKKTNSVKSNQRKLNQAIKTTKISKSATEAAASTGNSIFCQGNFYLNNSSIFICTAQAISSACNCVKSFYKHSSIKVTTKGGVILAKGAKLSFSQTLLLFEIHIFIKNNISICFVSI